ncbi:hypothetical protein J2Y48_000622 [Mycoplana sp. BE70]|nr:hypothetical protein [Mycoplana sp. BE70]
MIAAATRSISAVAGQRADMASRRNRQRQ